MTLALLAPLDGVDLTADYWRVAGSRPTVLEVNGCRFYLEHWQRVERARRALEQSVGTELQSNNRAER